MFTDFQRTFGAMQKLQSGAMQKFLCARRIMTELGMLTERDLQTVFNIISSDVNV